MSKGSKRQRQLRKVRDRRVRRQVLLVGEAYRRMLDSQLERRRMRGLTDDLPDTQTLHNGKPWTQDILAGGTKDDDCNQD
jgi:hypothetical protein